MNVAEDWEGPHFDCYDVPFVANFGKDKNGQYERRYLFNPLSLRTSVKSNILDKYWFGNREDDVKMFAD